jgi:hypothetical protein
MIYYRNSNRRIESAPISNSNDLRDLIELAASKKMKSFQKLGLTIAQSEDPKRLRIDIISNDKRKLDEELGGL